MSKYYMPEFREEQFNCVYCNVYSSQKWESAKIANGATRIGVDACRCSHCKKYSYWDNETEQMVIPSESIIEHSHEDMPSEILSEYNEARSIFSKSPRASSALLRLSIQKLLPILGAKESNINKAIQELVDGGLSIKVQKALDICRVVGNNAIHPGEIDINETPEKARILFTMINFIIEDLIAKPKKIDEMYASLPKGALDAIETRRV